jgi:hypothetical protein
MADPDYHNMSHEDMKPASQTGSRAKGGRVLLRLIIFFTYETSLIAWLGRLSKEALYSRPQHLQQPQGYQSGAVVRSKFEIMLYPGAPVSSYISSYISLQIAQYCL